MRTPGPATGMALLVATDLDGCLLDEETYRFEAARPALARLAEDAVPLVLATSKTRAEVAHLREELRASAVIVENGGALLMPEGGAAGAQARFGDAGGCSTVVLGEARQELLPALDELTRLTGARVRSFGQLDAEELARLTGLDAEAAARALQREYDEPFLLEGDDHARLLAAAAHARGLRVTRGGRFWHLTGATDKGQALRRLLGFYSGQGQHFTVVALGDSPNDLPLLRAADRAIVMPRPDGTLDPELCRGLPAAERAPRAGPAGWNSAVLAVLSGQRLPGMTTGA